MSSLFEDVVSQYIDDNGKLRMLTYSSGLCLMTSPLPPLDIPINKKIFETTKEELQIFLAEKDLEITMQDGDSEDQLIQGVWVEEKDSQVIYYGYIPIKITNAIEGVKFVTPSLNDPLRTDSTSELGRMRNSRKIADFLKQYTMYEYSLDPDNFSEDSFVVDPNHEYKISNLEKKLFKDGNKIMYRGGKLIVPSEDIKKKLQNFLQVQLLNDTPSVIEYHSLSLVKDYYRTIDDFQKIPEQLIFLSKSSLLGWKKDLKNEGEKEIITYTKPYSYEPYLYRNYNILKGEIAIVQNVEYGMLDLALTVATKWDTDRINLGHDPIVSPASETTSYKVYSEELGEIDEVEREDQEVHILQYSKGYYAALLFIK